MPKLFVVLVIYFTLVRGIKFLKV